jgi:hypothetical protein
MRHVVTACLCLGLNATAVVGQVRNYDAGLLERARAAAAMTPGSGPNAVSYGEVAGMWVPRSYFLGVESTDSLPALFAMFQIRYDDSWIAVDGAGPAQLLGVADRPHVADSAISVLRGARSIVATHEHHDHVGWLVLGDHVSDIAGKTLLTTEQLAT